MAVISNCAGSLLLAALVLMAVAQVSMENVEEEMFKLNLLGIQDTTSTYRRLLQMPIPIPAPAPAPALDCGAACEERCKMNYRHNLCVRACGTCCMRCKCVPPGQSGNREVCGTCYADMKTHRNQTKCP